SPYQPPCIPPIASPMQPHSRVPEPREARPAAHARPHACAHSPVPAAAGPPRAVALSSSDPTILAVPPQITVAPGASSATFNVTPLKSGTATVTASLGGASLPALVYVADSGGSMLTLNWYGSRRLLPGADPQFVI